MRPLAWFRGRRYLAGVTGKLMRRQVSLAVVGWVVVGLVVAARNDFLQDLGSLSRVLSALLAVSLWPFVILDIHFGI